VAINDGAVRLKVTELDGRRVRCVVEIAGVVTSQKGVNLPGAYLPLASITDDDKDNLEFALDHDVDYVAQSFVRRPEDVDELRALIAEHGDARARIIAKIEKAEAIEQLEGIVAATDGLMVARGDLGVEIGTHDVPLAQKRIIRLGREAGKPVITATQMLESMIERPEPTRAEASDVANAILDGTSAVMLSGETAVGRYPIQAVKTMVRIAGAVEPSLRYHDTGYELSRLGSRYIADVVGHAACDMAETLGVACIVVPTVTGRVGARGLEAPPEPDHRGRLGRPRRPPAARLEWGVVGIPLDEAGGARAALERGGRRRGPRRPRRSRRQDRDHLGHDGQSTGVDQHDHGPHHLSLWRQAVSAAGRRADVRHQPAAQRVEGLPGAEDGRSAPVGSVDLGARRQAAERRVGLEAEEGDVGVVPRVALRCRPQAAIDDREARRGQGRRGSPPGPGRPPRASRSRGGRGRAGRASARRGHRRRARHGRRAPRRPGRRRPRRPRPSSCRATCRR
jgi:pyruvate kinase